MPRGLPARLAAGSVNNLKMRTILFLCFYAFFCAAEMGAPSITELAPPPLQPNSSSALLPRSLALELCGAGLTLCEIGGQQCSKCCVSEASGCSCTSCYTSIGGRYWDANGFATTCPAGQYCSGDQTMVSGTVSEGQYLTLTCPYSMFSSVLAVYYGVRNCGVFRITNERSTPANSIPMVKAACVGKSTCSIKADNAFFGNVDPCPWFGKTLIITLTCGYGKTLCPAGTWSDPGESSCSACDAGKYNPSTGSTYISDCLSCAAGTHNPNTGSASNSACLSCAAGKYSAAGAASCSNCGPVRKRRPFDPPLPPLTHSPHTHSVPRRAQRARGAETSCPAARPRAVAGVILSRAALPLNSGQA